MNHSEFEHLKELMVLGDISAEELEQRLRIYESVNDEESLMRLKQLIDDHGHGLKGNLTDDTEPVHVRPMLRRTPLLWMAASIALLLAIGGLVWHTQYTEITPPEISEDIQLAMQRSVDSGRASYTVNSYSSGEGRDHSSVNTKTGNGIIVGKATQSTNADLSSLVEDYDLMDAHYVTTMHDKEFWLTLDDGTLVHLNHNTHVIYPEKFGHKKREIIIEGEAYFMVAKDRSRPFIAHTPNGDVKVYGTEFMVNTKYEKMDEPGNLSTEVVLIKGKVGFTPKNGHELMMNPGQQCSIIDGQWSIQDVDLAPYIAWNIGRFSFREWSLEQVMNVIGRWYGYRVEFASNKMASKEFSGNFDRYDDIHSTLEAIETVTDYKIKISNQTIYINQ